MFEDFFSSIYMLLYFHRSFHRLP